ncbi:hypothetical protein Tco_0698568 [Tanacetum coccineum]
MVKRIARVHGVHNEKRIWFEVELQGAQGDREAEVFQVSNNNIVVAQRRLKDKQPKEKTNTDYLVKKQEKEYQTGWKIKTGIQQQNELVDETNVTLSAKVYISSELFRYREDNNEVAFAVAAVEKIYAHESLTFNNTIACEVIFEWKAILEDDMDARSDVLRSRLPSVCWRKQKEMYLTLVEGHFIPSLKGSLSGDCDMEKNGKWSCIYAVGSREYQTVCTRLDIASADVGSLKANLQHMEAFSTTEAGYMMFTEAWKKKIWLKGLLTESRYELRLVAGIATGALVKGGSRSKVSAQVEVAAYRY